MGQAGLGERRVRVQRLALEAATIVLSILLAFAIDAWWDGRVERAREREYLRALQAEFGSADTIIRAELAQLEAAGAATRRILSLHPDEASQVETEELADLFVHILSVGRANLPSGSLDALMSSGDLRLIQNRELATKLAGWPSLVAEAWENATWLVEHRERELAPFMSEYVGGLWTARRSGLLDDYPDTRFSPRVRQLFSDPHLEGNLASVAVRIELMLDRYHALLVEADAIQTSIAQELDG